MPRFFRRSRYYRRAKRRFYRRRYRRSRVYRPKYRFRGGFRRRRLARSYRRVVAPEKKVLMGSSDLAVFGHDMSSAVGGAGNASTLVATIPQGYGAAQRVGLKVGLLNFKMEGRLVSDSDAVIVHMAVVRESAPVYVATRPAVGLVYDQYGMRVRTEVARFHVLKHKRYSLVRRIAGVEPSRAFHFNVPLRIAQSYAGPAGAVIDDIRHNAIMVFFWTTNPDPSAVADDAVITFESRLYYVDA